MSLNEWGSLEKELLDDSITEVDVELNRDSIRDWLDNVLPDISEELPDIEHQEGASAGLNHHSTERGQLFPSKKYQAKGEDYMECCGESRDSGIDLRRSNTIGRMMEQIDRNRQTKWKMASGMRTPTSRLQTSMIVFRMSISQVLLKTER